ncbi:MAG TPA: TraB/GumN family protein, partial [Paraburkholderia sp.]|nr:TraB/GumN family protein [Paraburkholderia sp.]
SAMRKYAFYGSDDNITNHLSRITPEQLARCVRAENKSIVKFFQLKPWLAALDIATHRPVAGTGEGGTGAPMPKRTRMGIDQRLFRLATRSHMPVLYLETVEEGLRVLDTLPADEQEAWLSDACNSLTTGLTPDEVPVAEFEDAWIRGDIAKFENLTTVPPPGGKPEIFDANQRIFQNGTDLFAAAIARYGYFHGKGPILVAVGAGHFFGKRSLLNELEAAGYQVTAPRGGA